MSKFVTKTYKVAFGDKEEAVEQDTPLRALEQVIGYDTVEVTIDKIKYTITVVEPEE